MMKTTASIAAIVRPALCALLCLLCVGHLSAVYAQQADSTATDAPHTSPASPASAGEPTNDATPARKHPWPDHLMMPQGIQLQADVQDMPFRALDHIGAVKPQMYYSLDSAFNNSYPLLGFDVEHPDTEPDYLVRSYEGHPAMDVYGLLALTVKAVQELRYENKKFKSKLSSFETSLQALTIEMESLRKFVHGQYGSTEKANQAYNKAFELEAKVKELEKVLEQLKPE